MTRTVALIYIRKSVVRTTRDELSPERQRAACVAYCASRGWAPEVYEDAEGHRSGRTETHRPAWRDLKRQLSRPDVVAVVANSLDRLSRSPRDFFVFLEELQRYGVELVSISEQFDTSTAIGRAFLAILMVVASLESDMASERVSATISYRKAQGLHWGYNPFGYDRKDGVLTPNADAPHAVACLERYASGDTSFVHLAGDLNASSLRFRNRDSLVADWTRDSVRSVVSNVLIYAGYIHDGHGKNLRPAGATLESLIADASATPGAHPPLISEATARAVIAARTRRYEHRIRRNYRVYPLASILYCAACGCALRGKTDRRGPVYAHHGPACGQPILPADDMERKVIDLISTALRLPDSLLAAVRATFRERIQARTQETPLQADLDKLTAKRKRLINTYIQGELTEEEYETRRAELDASIRRIETQVRPDYNLDRILAQLPALADLIRNGSLSQQRKTLTSIFARVNVEDGEIQKAAPTEAWRPFFHDLHESMRHEMPPRDVLTAICRMLELCRQ